MSRITDVCIVSCSISDKPIGFIITYLFFFAVVSNCAHFQFHSVTSIRVYSFLIAVIGSALA